MRSSQYLREVSLKEGTWPNRSSPDERENMARLAPKCHPQAPDACQDGVVDDKWQARNFTTSLSKAWRKFCRLGYSDHNSLYARLWRDAKPMLVPAISHLFWEQFTRSSKKLTTCTVRKALKLRWDLLECQIGQTFSKSSILGRHLMVSAPSAGIQTLARMSFEPAHIGLSKGYILRDTMKLLQLLERQSWKEPTVAAWQS